MSELELAAVAVVLITDECYCNAGGVAVDMPFSVHIPGPFTLDKNCSILLLLYITSSQPNDADTVQLSSQFRYPTETHSAGYVYP